MFTTTPIALADAATSLLSPLERRGVRVGEAAVVFSIALCFVPALAREVDTIVAAQKATRSPSWKERGPWRTRAPACRLHVPLFASALRHAENLGRAMDARCYTGTGRTHYHVLRFDARRDGIALAAFALYLGALAALAAGVARPLPSPLFDRFRGICRAKWMFPQACARKSVTESAESAESEGGDPAKTAGRCAPSHPLLTKSTQKPHVD